MNGPTPDPNPLIVGARRWRVQMKSGEQRLVAADTLEPIGSFGLAFRTRDIVVYGVAFGAYAEFAEIDPEDDATPHVQVIPALDDGEPVDTTNRKTTELLRRCPAALPPERRDDGLSVLWGALPENGDWIALSVARTTFKETVGGFPPRAYKRFNEALSAAKANGLVEVVGDS